MQFRTMPVSNPYQNVVHVHAASKSQEDLAKHQVSNRRVCEMFILGSPRADQHSARKAAASAAIHALNDAEVIGAIAPVYGGTFAVSVATTDCNSGQATQLARALLARFRALSTGVIDLTSAQVEAADRLSKILERVDRCTFGEQRNARNLHSRELARVEWSEFGLRSYRDSLNPSSDLAGVRACIEVRFTKKITTKRQWFESAAGGLAALKRFCKHVTTFMFFIPEMILK